MITWVITTRTKRLSEPLPDYPYRAIGAHLMYEKEVFVFGINDGTVFELMLYFS